MNRPSYRLSRLEWLNTRGWPTFKDFMVTHKYDPTSVADYMKAEEVLCNYRSSDPFANMELKNWGVEEDEDEELEELEEKDMDEEMDEDFEKILCNALASEEYMDEEDMDEGMKVKNCDEEGVEEVDRVKNEVNDPDNNQERDEILDLMTDDSDWEDYDEDEDPDGPRDSNFKRYIEVREQEKHEKIYRFRNEDEGIYEWLMKRGWSCLEEYMNYHTLDFANDHDVEKVGDIIRKSIRLEAEQNCAEAEGDIEEVEFPRNTNLAEPDEEEATDNPSVSNIADRIRNNREIDRWCMEQGFINLFNFINGHGGEYYDDELVSMIGRQLEGIIEEGNQNGREVMEGIFEGLTMCDNKDQELREDFQDWPVADNEEMNRLDGDDEMAYGWM
ncbi:hypothetical protein EAE96_005170 [Botrytis aclada]|nr:hypothetical protein EAE96_005170 [Botrytis aclada]